MIYPNQKVSWLDFWEHEANFIVMKYTLTRSCRSLYNKFRSHFARYVCNNIKVMRAAYQLSTHITIEHGHDDTSQWNVFYRQPFIADRIFSSGMNLFQ